MTRPRPCGTFANWRPNAPTWLILTAKAFPLSGLGDMAETMTALEQAMVANEGSDRTPRHVRRDDEREARSATITTELVCHQFRTVIATRADRPPTRAVMVALPAREA